MGLGKTVSIARFFGVYHGNISKLGGSDAVRIASGNIRNNPISVLGY